MATEAQQLDKWAASNNMLLNVEKSVELRICFPRNPPQPAPLFLGGKEVLVVTTTEYLGFCYATETILQTFSAEKTD